MGDWWLLAALAAAVAAATAWPNSAMRRLAVRPDARPDGRTGGRPGAATGRSLGGLRSRPDRGGWAGAGGPFRLPWARPRARHDVATVCLLLAICIDAGRPPRSALRVVVDVVGPVEREALAGVLRQVDLGLDEAAAWASLGEVPGYAAMARDLSRAVHQGVALAALLRRHAADARRAAVADAQVRARAAGVTGVLPVVLCFLPAFVLVGIVPIFGALVMQVLG